MLISLTCKGPSKQRYTIQSYPVNWHFHSIIPHPKNKTYIRKPWSPATPSVGWFVEAQGSWYKSQRCYLGGDRMSWLSPGWMFHIQTKQHDTQTQCSFETWFCVWSTKGKFFSSRTSNRTSPHFPTDFFRYHSFFPSFHLILCTRLILCTLEETNAPVFYKDCLTPTAPFLIKKRKAQPISCLGSELVCHSLLSLLFFRNFNDDVVWMFLLLCLATKTSSTIPNSKEVQCEQAARRNPVL